MHPCSVCAKCPSFCSVVHVELPRGGKGVKVVEGHPISECLSIRQPCPTLYSLTSCSTHPGVTDREAEEVEKRGGGDGIAVFLIKEDSQGGGDGVQMWFLSMVPCEGFLEKDGGSVGGLPGVNGWPPGTKTQPHIGSRLVSPIPPFPSSGNNTEEEAVTSVGVGEESTSKEEAAHGREIGAPTALGSVRIHTNTAWCGGGGECFEDVPTLVGVLASFSASMPAVCGAVSSVVTTHPIASTTVFGGRYPTTLALSFGAARTSIPCSIVASHDDGTCGTEEGNGGRYAPPARHTQKYRRKGLRQIGDAMSPPSPWRCRGDPREEGGGNGKDVSSLFLPLRRDGLSIDSRPLPLVVVNAAVDGEEEEGGDTTWYDPIVPSAHRIYHLSSEIPMASRTSPGRKRVALHFLKPEEEVKDDAGIRYAGRGQ